MRAFNRILIGALILLTASFVHAQSQDPVGLTDFPVPEWPKDGKIPADLKDKYVFIDLSKNEYVVSYPENLPVNETPAAKEAYEKDGPGTPRTGHYELLRSVEPAVLLTVTSNAGKYKYAYSVADGPKAKQSIDQWSIVVPEAVADSAMKHPAGWFGVMQKGREYKLKNPDWIKQGGAAVWSFEKAEQVIQPGGVLTGFELETDYRPGFTIGYFKKAESTDALVAASGCGPGANCTGLPKPVQDQVNSLLRVEYDSKTMLVLGPKFDKSADDKTVAADFVQGITLMTQTGQLDANSDFVKNALTELKNVQTSGNGSAMKLTAQPKTPAETQILGALKISLHLS